MSVETYIVACDGEDNHVLDFAIARALKNAASLHLVHILEWSPYKFLTQEELQERHARRKEELTRADAALMAPAIEYARQAGIENVSSDLRYGSIVEQLAEIATEKASTFIFVGRATGAGITERIFGSVPLGLAQVSTVPVVIVP